MPDLAAGSTPVSCKKDNFYFVIGYRRDIPNAATCYITELRGFGTAVFACRCCPYNSGLRRIFGLPG
jgi:hypothetical protein